MAMEKTRFLWGRNVTVFLVKVKAVVGSAADMTACVSIEDLFVPAMAASVTPKEQQVERNLGVLVVVKDDDAAACCGAQPQQPHVEQPEDPGSSRGHPGTLRRVLLVFFL